MSVRIASVFVVMTVVPWASTARAQNATRPPATETREQDGSSPQGQGATIRSTGDVTRVKSSSPSTSRPPATPAVTGVPATPAQEVKVGIGPTGTTDWDFRNARNPPRIEARDNDVDLHFLNVASGLTVKLTIDRVAIPPRPGFSPLWLLGLTPGELQTEARRQFLAAVRLADEAVAVARTAVTPSSTLEAPALGLQRLLATTEFNLNCALAETAGQAAAGCAASPGREAVKTELERAANTVAAFVGGVAPPTVPLPPSGGPWTVEGVVSALASFQRDNGPQAQGGAAATLQAALVAVGSLSAGIGPLLPATVLVPTTTSPPPLAAAVTAAAVLDARRRAETAYGAVIDDCKREGIDVVCTPTLTIAANSSGVLRNALLRQYPKGKVVRFRISFPYALDAEQPAAPFGYVTFDETLTASPSAAIWSATGIVQFSRLPVFGADGATIDAAHPYEGASTRQASGRGRMAVNYTLGNRAAAAVELQFKNGTLGNDGLAVTANQYSFEAFGYSGTSVKFGKYTFATPTDGLAINETGEGATVRYRWLGASRIVRREESTASAAPRDGDHSSWLFDVSNIAVPGWTSLRWVSLYGLLGRDDVLARSRQYRTVGGEAVFGLPTNLTGLVAYYRSQSEPRSGSLASGGRGTAALLRISRSWFDDAKAARTFVVTVAEGSGDRPETSTRYDGYLGENGSLAPDGSLFISAVVPRLRVEPNPFEYATESGKTATEFADKGLANRRFVGVAFTELQLSPLEWLAGLLRVPKTDVEARQTSARLHYYGASEPLKGTRQGSWELQAETLLESPAGVKYSVKASRFFGRGPLESIFPREPWSMVMQCIITIKT